MEHSEKSGGSHFTHMERLKPSRGVCFAQLRCTHTHSACVHTAQALCFVVVQSLSRVRLFATPSTVAHQAPLSMGFSRQEYWSGLPFPSPGDLPHPGNEPASPASAGGFFTTEPQLAFDCMLMYLWQESLRFFGLISILIGSERAPQIWKSVSKQTHVSVHLPSTS